jgi:hypothetical protein
MSMMSVAAPHVPEVERPSALARLWHDEPRYAGMAAMLLVLAMPLAFAALVDDRSFQGADVWLKPLKFAFALIVYVGTLAFFARFVPAERKAGRGYRIFVSAVLVAIVAEMIWIIGAAAMGTSSHFNETPAGQTIYRFMGAAAVLLTSASAVQAWQIARHGPRDMAPALRESIVVGLALVLPLTLASAGTLSVMGGHFVGEPTGAAGLAILGWSREVGDLRVAHFFATHAMHFLPAFGLVAALALGTKAVMPVRIFAAAYAGLVAFAMWQALAGRPFLPMIG